MKRKVNAKHLAAWFGRRQPETLVDRCFACPRCGERRMDWLTPRDDDIECHTCHHTYSV